MKKSKENLSRKSSKDIAEKTTGLLDNSVVVSDSLNISQTSGRSSGRLDETKMGETTMARTNENNAACPEQEVTSSELRKGHENSFCAGREVAEKASTNLINLQASTGSSDEQVGSRTAPTASSEAKANIAPSSVISTNSNFNVSSATGSSEAISCNLNGRNFNRSHAPDNPHPSFADKSVNEELPAASEKTDSRISRPNEKNEGVQKNISVISVVRKTNVLDSTKASADGSFHSVHFSQPNKSREINQQREIFQSHTMDNLPMSINVREVITTDIPQSLSTDSGIGSPLDVRTCIDPSPGQDTKLGQDSKWEAENYSLSSLPSVVVVPNFKDRPGNYPPCEFNTDNLSQPSSSDTSNYSTSSATTPGKSVRTNAFLKQDTHSGSSLTSGEERNLDLQQTASPYEQAPTAQALATPLSDKPQNTLELEANPVGLASKHLSEANTCSLNEAYPTRSSELEALPNSKLADSTTERINSSVCTFQTSEFTIEYESGNSNCEHRNETISSSAVGKSESRPSISDLAETLKNSQLSEKLNRFSKVAERIRKHNSESSKEDITEEINSTGAAPPGRKVKGILKTTSAPILGESRDKTRTLAELKNEHGKGEAAATRSVSFNQTHITSTFSYNNVAFEGEIITEPSKRASLAEVVNQMMRHSAVVDMDEDNSHPYGRDSSLTDLMTGKHRDSYKMDAGKMIVWLALAIMIVSLAGGIIFMSETYNIAHRDDDEITSRYETTTHEHPK